MTAAAAPFNLSRGEDNFVKCVATNNDQNRLTVFNGLYDQLPTTYIIGAIFLGSCKLIDFDCFTVRMIADYFIDSFKGIQPLGPIGFTHGYEENDGRTSLTHFKPAWNRSIAMLREDV